MNEDERPGDEPAVTKAVGGGGSWALWGVTVFLLVYFLCPVILLMPVLLINPRSRTLNSRLEVVFWPVGYLAQKIPAYGRMLEAEANWMQRYVPIP